MSCMLNRRDFLSGAALTTAALLLPNGAAGAGRVTTRVLGRTGLRVTEVGMGVMLTSDPAVVRAALDLGVNYFDTARAYLGGRNEEILAEGLAGRRKEVVIATTCHRLGSRDSVIASCEESLRALRTETIDIFQLHGLSDRGSVLNPEHLEAVERLRQAGKIRFAGVTTHTGMVEVMDAAVAAKVYDTVLTTYSHSSPPEVGQAIGRTSAAGLGVIAMKVMSGGYRLDPDPGVSPFPSAIRWVLRNNGVATAIPSMTTIEQAREDIAVMGTTFGLRDRAIVPLHARAVRGLYCRGCRSCEGECPRGADVPEALRALMYADGYGRPELARATLAGGVLPCPECEGCTVRCRFGIDVGRRMLLAAQHAGRNHA
jgi:aryl-alcohol dehydrogenase-like predicted oxidoreductase